LVTNPQHLDIWSMLRLTIQKTKNKPKWWSLGLTLTAK